jgi:citrate synthase
MKELQEKWMKFYMNIMVLRSNDPRAIALLETMQRESAEYNEKVMKFFEEMEAKA